MQSPKISIIVPVYNSELYLEQCLDSIIRQTLRDIEIICVNDGSTDKSTELLTFYSKGDQRFQILNQENAGAGLARNAALDAASGEFVAFVDADDWYPAEKVLEELYFQAKDNDVDVCGGLIMTCYENHSLIEHKEFPKYGLVEYSDYQYDYGYYGFIYKLDMLRAESIVFPPYRRFQDPPFMVSAMYSAKRFYAINQVVYNYRAGHSDVNWNPSNLSDLISGITDNLRFSKTRSLAELHLLSAKRLECDYCDRIIHNLNFDVSVLKLLYRAVHEIDIELIRSLAPDFADGFQQFNILDKAHEDVKCQIKAFRIGRLITFLPRKIRDFIMLKGEAMSDGKITDNAMVDELINGKAEVGDTTAGSGAMHDDEIQTDAILCEIVIDDKTVTGSAYCDAIPNDKMQNDAKLGDVKPSGGKLSDAQSNGTQPGGANPRGAQSICGELICGELSCAQPGGATPKVSIIMPVYNVEKYLRQCLDSVISQTISEIEIICVNDGSSDASGNILNEYMARDKRIHVINKNNSGYGHTMNCGLDVAVGEYIGIVETDDYVDKNMFSALYNLAKTHDADLVKSNYYAFTSEKSDSSRFLVDLCGGLPVEKIFSPIEQCNDFLYLQPCIWAAIYRREFIEQNGIRFNETPGASYQDTSFAFRVHAMTDRALLTNKPFYHYRTDNENSSVHAAAKIFSVCDEYRVIEEYFSARPERSATMQSIITRAKCDTYLWNYRRLGAEYQYAFLLTMANELRRERKMGRLPLETYPAELKMEIGELLTNLDAFFKRTAKAYNGGLENIGRFGQYKQDRRSGQDGYYEQEGYYGIILESNKIANSASFRIGMAITWLPRKIRGGFRCWKQHGLTYTLRLLFKNKLFRKR